MKIDDKSLEGIKEQAGIRDAAAFALGVALAEYEIEKVKISENKEFSNEQSLLRLGAVQSEFDGHRDLHMKIVMRSRARQKALGDAALAAVGLQTGNGREFTIDLSSGDVLELLAGAWIPVERRVQ